MRKEFAIVLLSLLLSLTISSQDICEEEFEKIDKLLTRRTLAKAKQIILEIEQTQKLSTIDWHKLYALKIKASRKENDSIALNELMKEFVLNSQLDSIFSKCKKNRNFGDYRSMTDTFRIYTNKSSYSLALARNELSKKNYKEALKYLSIHESKYLSYHWCGNGSASYRVSRGIMHGEINQPLENHEQVIKMLLPLTFERSMSLVFDKKKKSREVDSIFMISLNKSCSRAETIAEFENNFKSIPASYRDNQAKFKLFDAEIDIYQTMISNLIKLEHKMNFRKIKDEHEKEKARKAIFAEAYKKTILNNRIYKHLLNN